MSEPYQAAVRDPDARFRLTLTDAGGVTTTRNAGSRATWLALSNAALNSRKPRYVRCETVVVLPDGRDVVCGVWTVTTATAFTEDHPAEQMTFADLMAQVAE